MAKTFKNPIELEAYLSSLMSVALNNTMEKLLNKLEEIIQEKVYDSYEGNWDLDGWRTGQFKESWEKTIPIIKGNLVESELFQNISNMIIYESAPVYIHTDRDNLAEIIESGVGYNFGSAPPRPFWNDFINWVEMNIYTIFEQECNKVGIKGMITYK